MERISRFYFVYVATVLILISNCAVGHEKRANVNRIRRLANDDSLQLQQQQHQLHQKSASESNVNQRNVNSVKDRYNNDKIIFDRGDIYEAKNTERTPMPSMATTHNLLKSNETTNQYIGKANGEYQFSLMIRNGIRRIESGEFELHNNQQVFVVRGFFEHIGKDGTVKVTAYVFDQSGYHEIPVTTDNDGVVDLYGPDQAHDCDISKGVYCIDRKLLSLMVG